MLAMVTSRYDQKLSREELFTFKCLDISWTVRYQWLSITIKKRLLINLLHPSL